MTKKKLNIKKLIILFGILTVVSSIIYISLSYSDKSNSGFVYLPFSSFEKIEESITEEEKHVNKPEHVKAIYMSSWVAGTTSFRNTLTQLLKDTELNSVVIDFKDSTGVVSIPAGLDASQDRINAGSKRAVDLAEYIKELHKDNVYVIARIAVFQDPVYAQNNPKSAIKTSNGTLWQDRHGLSWVDASSPEFHKYVLDLSLEAYDMGFDEINLDYIRFPTDGSNDRVFPISNNTPKQIVITNFLTYMHNELFTRSIPLSVDVFGQIVSTKDDMGIGQYYEDILKNTDTISPMIYPSHFYPGYKGLKSPESNPYETIRLSLSDAITRRNAITSITEIRPWIQDFSLAVYYDTEHVKAQIKSAADLGIYSYMVWDPKNKYTKNAFVLDISN